MVHVAHNCEIGRHVVVAAQTGFSGGVVVGDYAVVGGRWASAIKRRSNRKLSWVQAPVFLHRRSCARESRCGARLPVRLRNILQQLASVARLPRLMEQIKELIVGSMRLATTSALAERWLAPGCDVSRRPFSVCAADVKR